MCYEAQRLWRNPWADKKIKPTTDKYGYSCNAFDSIIPMNSMPFKFLRDKNGFLRCSYSYIFIFVTMRLEVWPTFFYFELVVFLLSHLFALLPYPIVWTENLWPVTKIRYVFFRLKVIRLHCYSTRKTPPTKPNTKIFHLYSIRIDSKHRHRHLMY